MKYINTKNGQIIDDDSEINKFSKINFSKITYKIKTTTLLFFWIILGVSVIAFYIIYYKADVIDLISLYSEFGIDGWLECYNFSTIIQNTKDLYNYIIDIIDKIPKY